MSEQKEKRTELTELGEFGLIDRLSAGITLSNKSSVKGIGDDAAVINNGDLYTLVSTDLLVEGVHFDLTYTPLKHLGYKSAVVNFSDICAMNGLPQQLTVGLAVSSRFRWKQLKNYMQALIWPAKNTRSIWWAVIPQAVPPVCF